MFKCGKCGLPIDIKDSAARECGHDNAPITADMEAVATGESGFLE